MCPSWRLYAFTAAIKDGVSLLSLGTESQPQVNVRVLAFLAGGVFGPDSSELGNCGRVNVPVQKTAPALFERHISGNETCPFESLKVRVSANSRKVESLGDLRNGEPVVPTEHVQDLRARPVAQDLNRFHHLFWHVGRVREARHGSILPHIQDFQLAGLNY
jgi:hypothetical protein